MSKIDNAKADAKYWDSKLRTLNLRAAKLGPTNPKYTEIQYKMEIAHHHKWHALEELEGGE